MHIREQGCPLEEGRYTETLPEHLEPFVPLEFTHLLGLWPIELQAGLLNSLAAKLVSVRYDRKED